MNEMPGFARFTPRSIERGLLSVTVADVALGGNGYLVQIYGIRARVILFAVCMIWTVLRVVSVYPIKLIPEAYVWILIAFITLTGFDAGLGYINGNSLAAILGELKPLSYFPMILFFCVAIQRQEDVTLVALILTACGSLLAILYLVAVFVTNAGFVDTLGFSTALSTSDEFIFRGLTNVGFFYKGMFYTAVAVIFLLIDPFRVTKVMGCLALIAMGLTLTRGLVFALLICISVGLLIGREWKRAASFGGAALVLIATLLLASSFDASSTAALNENACVSSERAAARTYLDFVPATLKRVTETVSRPADALRISDFGLLKTMNWQTILIGRGLGSEMRKDGQTRIELDYVEILYKQGIWGLLIWLVFFAFTARTYLQLAPAAAPYGRAFLLTMLFVYLANLTNTFLTGSTGMAGVFLSAACLRVLATDHRPITPHSWYGVDWDEYSRYTRVTARFASWTSGIKRSSVVFIILALAGTAGLIMLGRTRQPEISEAESEYRRLISASEASAVHTVRDLKTVAYHAGLTEGLLYGAKQGAGLAANVGTLQREAGGYIQFVGYAFDDAAPCNPVHFYLFLGGHPIAAAEARGQRADITAGFKLTPETAENVGIAGRSDEPVPCSKATDIFALIVDRKKNYMVLEPSGSYPSNGRIPPKVSGCD